MLLPASLPRRTCGRPISAEIPKVYQPRLDPDRFSRAQGTGANAASERAVERRSDWLSRHQDRGDGRWDGGIARYKNGTPVKGDDNFTVHCPPGGDVFRRVRLLGGRYGLDGIGLTTVLGAGYTHIEGRYAETVEKGLDFLIEQQKPDGDLPQARAASSACIVRHGHAGVVRGLCTHRRRTLARSRGAGVGVSQSRPRPRRAGLGHMHGRPVGDTSILGWIVMGLKSAKEVGIPIPDELSLRQGTLLWLNKVAKGPSKGLASYQPLDPITPTMTAEAWVCRQFLGVGGQVPPARRRPTFCSAMTRTAGPPIFTIGTTRLLHFINTVANRGQSGMPRSATGSSAFNAARVINLEAGIPMVVCTGPKEAGSIARLVAALTLEVYYRYLRLYDEPKIPVQASQTLDLEPGSLDLNRSLPREANYQSRGSMKPGTEGRCLKKIGEGRFGYAGFDGTTVLFPPVPFRSCWRPCRSRSLYWAGRGHDRLTLPVHDELGKVPGDLASELGIG